MRFLRTVFVWGKLSLRGLVVVATLALYVKNAKASDTKTKLNNAIACLNEYVYVADAIISMHKESEELVEAYLRHAIGRLEITLPYQKMSKAKKLRLAISLIGSMDAGMAKTTLKGIFLERIKSKIPLEILKARKMGLEEFLRIDQPELLDSVDLWIDTLFSDDFARVSLSTKLYVLEAVSRLSRFNYDTWTIMNRSAGTTGGWPRLLSDPLLKTLGAIDSAPARKLKRANFRLLYQSLVRTHVKNNFNANETRGVWRKYSKGEENKLTEDLKNCPVPWCTWSPIMAKKYLNERGQLYVYFTYDEFGKPTFPRILADGRGMSGLDRLEGLKQNGEIEEILEGVVFNISRADSRKFFENESMLTSIEKKVLENPSELTKDDLIFLYRDIHTDEGLSSYGRERVDALRKLRKDYIREDVARVYGVGVRDIGTSKKDFISGKYRVHVGDIKLSPREFSKYVKNQGKFKQRPIYYGNIVISGPAKIDKLPLPSRLHGNLTILDTKEIKSISFPSFMKGNISTPALQRISFMNFPAKQFGNIIMPELLDTGRVVSGLHIQGNVLLPKARIGEFIPVDAVVLGELNLQNFEWTLESGDFKVVEVLRYNSKKGYLRRSFGDNNKPFKKIIDVSKVR